MKKTLLITTIICSIASAALSQTRTRYALDNFDTGKVAVVSSQPQVSFQEKAPAQPKKLVKKTSQVSQRTMSVQEALSLRDNAQPTYVSDSRMMMASGNSLGGFTTGSPEHDSYIVGASNMYGIDPMLIYAQMHQESGFKLRATSHKGASGLMQLMPATAIRFGVTEIYNPRQNVYAGVKYMRWLLDKFGGDIRLALAGYNAGEGAVMKYGNNIPPYRETQEYVRRITTRYASIRNPNYVRTVKKVSPVQIAKLEKKEAKPLTVYEPNALAVRLPDGRMRLVNQ